jgi:hypothetical protein
MADTRLTGRTRSRILLQVASMADAAQPERMPMKTTTRFALALALVAGRRQPDGCDVDERITSGKLQADRRRLEGGGRGVRRRRADPQATRAAMGGARAARRRPARASATRAAASRRSRR